MKCNLIGVKKVDGVGKDGKPYAFSVAHFIGEMSEFDVQKGGRGRVTHEVMVPDRLVKEVNETNIGKDFDCEFYYAKNRENLAYAAVEVKK